MTAVEVGPGPTPAGRRERHKASTRAALIESALRLFDERGYAAVTVEDICEDADVSPRTFFRYFPAKDDVLLAPVREFLDLALTALRERPSDEPAWDAMRGTLRELARDMSGRAEEVRRTWRILAESPGTVGANARSFVDWEVAMTEQVTARLHRRTPDLRARILTATALVAFRHAVDDWAVASPPASLVRRVDTALDLVERGPQE